jgi:membrane protein implicated in regulation of membrane protease activity
MTWADFYLICFFVGFALSVLSLVIGALDIEIPGLDGGADVPADFHGGAPDIGDIADLAHAHGHTAHAGPHISPYNFSTIMAFLAWFGGTGYLLTRYSGFVSFLALGVSILAGLVGASVVFFFLVKVFMKHDFTLKAADYDMVGVLGRLTVGIREGGTGEMVFSLGGTRQTSGARSEDGLAIPTGSEVVVTRYEDGIAYVRRWEEVTNEEGESQPKASAQQD